MSQSYLASPREHLQGIQAEKVCCKSCGEQRHGISMKHANVGRFSPGGGLGLTIDVNAASHSVGSSPSGSSANTPTPNSNIASADTHSAFAGDITPKITHAPLSRRSSTGSMNTSVGRMRDAKMRGDVMKMRDVSRMKVVARLRPMLPHEMKMCYKEYERSIEGGEF